MHSLNHVEAQAQLPQEEITMSLERKGVSDPADAPAVPAAPAESGASRAFAATGGSGATGAGGEGGGREGGNLGSSYIMINNDDQFL